MPQLHQMGVNLEETLPETKTKTLCGGNKEQRNTDAPNNFGSGDSGVDNTRGFIHSASFQTFNRHQNSPSDFKVLEFRKEGPKIIELSFHTFNTVLQIQLRLESDVSDAIAFSGSDDHKELYPPKNSRHFWKH